MEIKIKTSVKNMEVANYILNIGIASLDDMAEDYRKIIYKLSDTDLKSAKAFLKSSTKALITGIKNES